MGFSTLHVCAFFSLLSIFGCTGSLLLHSDFSLPRLLLLQSMGPRARGLQQLQFTGSREWAQQLWHMGLAAARRVESSWTRDQTHVPCLGRWILNHWVPYMHFNGFYLLFAVYQALYKYLISSSCNLTTPDIIPIFQKTELKLRGWDTFLLQPR